MFLSATPLSCITALLKCLRRVVCAVFPLTHFSLSPHSSIQCHLPALPQLHWLSSQQGLQRFPRDQWVDIWQQSHCYSFILVFGNISPRLPWVHSCSLLTVAQCPLWASPIFPQLTYLMCVFLRSVSVPFFLSFSRPRMGNLSYDFNTIR